MPGGFTLLADWIRSLGVLDCDVFGTAYLAQEAGAIGSDGGDEVEFRLTD